MRIVIATVGTTGDIVPFVAVGMALQASGHDVTAISWDRWREPFEAAGMHFVAAGPHTTDEEISETARRAEAARSPLDQVAVLRDFHLRDASAHARELTDLLRGHDLALVHAIHSLAQAAAAHAGVPYATAVFDPVLLPTATAPPAGMPSLGPLNRALWWMLDRMLRRFNAPLHAALADAGMPSPELRLFRGRSTLLHLVACSPSIIEVPADLPSTSRVTGAWIDPRPPAALPAEVERFLEAGDAPLLVTFGSMASDAAAAHAAIVTSALATTGQRAIVQGLPVRASDTILPVGALDHRALMPRTQAVLHHGGAGTTHAVVAAGVPSIVVPHVGDQRYWADRLHRLGVAPMPIAPHELTVDRLVERLAAVDEEGMHARAGDLARQVRAETGVETAVAAVSASVPKPR